MVFHFAVEKKTEVVDGCEKCDLEKWFPVGRFGMVPTAMSHPNHDYERLLGSLEDLKFVIICIGLVMFGHANFDSLVTSCVVFLFFFDFCLYEKAVQIQRLPGLFKFSITWRCWVCCHGSFCQPCLFCTAYTTSLDDQCTMGV